MNKETVNNTITVEVPEGFHVMSAEELRLAYQSDDENRWGMWDKERHIMVTVMWKEYRGLLGMLLPDLKAVCKKNEQLISKGYAGHNYRCGGFFSQPLDGQPAEGYRFTYRVGDAAQAAETLLFRQGKTIYSVTLGGREENRAADEEVFTAVKAGIRIL